MASLSNLEIGSVVLNLVENIPVGISGTLPLLANLSVYTAENRTGDNISVDAVGEVYQPAVINLTISQVLSQMEAQGIGTKAVKIGELSISKGMQEGTSVSFKSLAFSQLNDLGHKSSYYQTFT